MQYVIAALVMIFISTTIGVINQRKARKRRIAEIRAMYGKKPEVKKFAFENVGLHWHQQTERVAEDEKIDDITWNDLDMDQVFARIASCSAFIGEQVLYSRLHTLPKDQEAIAKFDEKVRYFDAHNAVRESTQLLLDKFGFSNNSYTMPNYIANLGSYRIQNIWFYRVMQIVLALSILPALILWDARYMLLFIGVYCINLIIYMQSKSKYEVDLDMLGRILRVVKTGKAFMNPKKFDFPAGFHQLEKPVHAFGYISKGLELLYAKKEATIYGDVLGILQDYLIGATLWDFTKYDQIIDMMENKKSVFMDIFWEVGELDAAISVASYRRSLSLYTSPTFSTDETLEIRQAYHPLIDSPVLNDITLKGNCMITGSNASGKSTFIKAVALNLILGQNIYTCTARRVVMPLTRVITSMAVRDDLSSGESYYIKEIKYMNRILQSLDKKRFLVCFIDEILKGTNTEERIAASASILEYLSSSHCLAVVATHDIELTRMMRTLYENYYFRETMVGRDVVFDYKIHEGAAVSRNAIKLLEVVGFPEEVVSRAQALVQGKEVL